jgi:hypothetical protein
LVGTGDPEGLLAVGEPEAVDLAVGLTDWPADGAGDGGGADCEPGGGRLAPP